MRLAWTHVVLDARDPIALGRWWAEALGWVIVSDDVDEFEIRPAADELPGIIFEPVAHDPVAQDPAQAGAPKQKNRLHLDFRPVDQAVELQRLVDLGASPVDIGQGDVSWVVLADPEGNEFCLLQA